MSDVLKVRDFIRVRLTRNSQALVDMVPSTVDEDYTVYSADRAVLATNMATSQQINLGAVSTGGRIMLKTDRAILVGIGVTPANKLSLKDEGVFMATATFSHLWVRNTGAQSASIEYVVTD
jgi:hypothetical protein